MDPVHVAKSRVPNIIKVAMLEGFIYFHYRHGRLVEIPSRPG